MDVLSVSLRQHQGHEADDLELSRQFACTSLAGSEQSAGRARNPSNAASADNTAAGSISPASSSASSFAGPSVDRADVNQDPSGSSASKKKKKKKKKTTATSTALEHTSSESQPSPSLGTMRSMIARALTDPSDSVQTLQKEPNTATAEQREDGRYLFTWMFVDRDPQRQNKSDSDVPENEADDFSTRLSKIASAEDLLRQPHFDRLQAKPAHHFLRGLIHRVLRLSVDFAPEANPVANWRDLTSDLAQFECFDLNGLWKPLEDKIDDAELEKAEQSSKAVELPSERMARARKRFGHHHQSSKTDVHEHKTSQRAHAACQQLASTYVPYDPLRDPLLPNLGSMGKRGGGPMTFWRVSVLLENRFDGHVRTSEMAAMPSLTSSHGDCTVVACQVKHQIVNDRALQGTMQNVPFTIWIHSSLCAGTVSMPAFQLVYPLHVFTDDITGTQFVCAPEFIRAFFERWFTVMARQMHSLYSLIHPYGRGSPIERPAPFRLLDDSEWKKWVACPQALISSRSDPEDVTCRIWLDRGKAEVLFDAKCEPKEGTVDPGIGSKKGKNKAA